MSADVDPERLKAFSFLLFSKMEGAVTAGMVHLGDRLGLYTALAAAPGAVTSQELATRTGLHERWVREWLLNQAAARLLVSDDGESFSLSPEARAVLATPEHPAYGMGMFGRLPNTMAKLNELPESFRTGLGYDYDARGRRARPASSAASRPGTATFSYPSCLPALDGVTAKLEAGATAADVGCGAGVAVLTMAAAFPKSEFHGYDISHYALERAEAKRAEQGAGQRPLPRRRAPSRCPTTTRSISSRPSTASTT